MKLSLFLLTIVSAALAAPGSPDTRLVGGSPASIYDYPFIVSIVYADPETGEEEQKCVGSILSSWHVLTTASCFIDANIENFKFRVGSANSLEGGRLLDLYYLIIHPDYDESPRTADIAIAMLYDYIPMSGNVNVIYIPPQETSIPDGYTVRAVGWGYSGEDGPKVDLLVSFDTKTISQQQCVDAFADDENISVYDRTHPILTLPYHLEVCRKTDNFPISGQQHLPIPPNYPSTHWTDSWAQRWHQRVDGVICTQAPARSTCRGDSGAPLIIDDVLVGISSYSSTCDDSTPDVFTRIDRHTGWILQEAVSPYGRSGGSPVRVANV